MRSIFGWSLPPGCSMNDIDPPEGPCEVCGNSADYCLCPECSTCGSVGDPKCYENHNMVRNQQQINSRAALDKRIADDAAVELAAIEDEAEMWEKIQREITDVLSSSGHVRVC